MPGRIRTIKPEFFLSETLAELSPLHRLLFAGLWCYVDREGRGQDRPKSLKASILPFDDVNVDEMLNDLANHRSHFIYRYQVGGERYIQVAGFIEHQRPGNREPTSIIPPCKACLSVLKRDKAALKQDKARARVRPRRGEGKGREGKGRERSPLPPTGGVERFSRPAPENPGECSRCHDVVARRIGDLCQECNERTKSGGAA